MKSLKLARDVFSCYQLLVEMYSNSVISAL